jgi:hypothetical protein
VFVIQGNLRVCVCSGENPSIYARRERSLPICIYIIVYYVIRLQNLKYNMFSCSASYKRSIMNVFERK